MEKGYNFDQLADRRGTGSMKFQYMPEPVKRNQLVSLWGAEMDFKTAPCIIEGIKAWADKGLFVYITIDDAYVDAVRYWMSHVRGFEPEAESIVPNHGTIYGLATAIRAFTNPGESILVQPPVYYRYEQAATRLGRKTVYNPLNLSNGSYTIDFENLEQGMAKEDVKLMVLCNPHNPVGKIWPQEDLEKIAALASKYDVIVYSDEIFAEVTFEGRKTTCYSEVKGAASHSLVAVSLGKTFNFTGVNHANILIANEALRERYIRQRDADHYGSIEPFFYAAVCSAYTAEGIRWKEAMVDYVWDNVQFVEAFVSSRIPQIRFIKPEATYVGWLDLRDLDIEAEGLMQWLLEEASFYGDDGLEYGEEGRGFIRINLATPRQELAKLFERLAAAVERRDEGYELTGN